MCQGRCLIHTILQKFASMMERRDERERRIEVEQKQGIAPTSAENWKWGFYDKKSGYIQQPRYDEIYDLDCDDADAPILVGIGENYGYLVRSSGAIAIPFVYGYCGENSEFVWRSSSNRKYWTICCIRRIWQCCGENHW